MNLTIIYWMHQICMVLVRIVTRDPAGVTGVTCDVVTWPICRWRIAADHSDNMTDEVTADMTGVWIRTWNEGYPKVREG